MGGGFPALKPRAEPCSPLRGKKPSQTLLPCSKRRSVNNSGKAQFEVHLVVHAKNKCAGVSQSPTYVRHYELRARGDPAVLQVYFSVKRHPMILPVNPQDTMHINLAFTFHRDLTRNAVRRKNRFGKSIAFQYGFMHLPITRCHTRVSTLYIDHDLTAGLTSCDLPANPAALDFERTVDRVQQGAKGELNSALGRIEIDYDLLGGRGFLSAAPTAKPKYSRRSTRIGVFMRLKSNNLLTGPGSHDVFRPLLFNQVVFNGECIEASRVK